MTNETSPCLFTRGDKEKDKMVFASHFDIGFISSLNMVYFSLIGMSWSKKGALSLLKIKETILNGEWGDWWETERERNIKVGKYKPPLLASYFKKETETSPLIEVTIPALSGPDQGKPWVGVLRKLSEVGYY